MTDIVERLLEPVDYLPREVRQEAAAEIEWLRETDRLREVAFQAYADQEKKDRAEIELLRAAIRWALGEAPNDKGEWFGDVRPPLEARYWWRIELRRALKDTTP